MFVFISLSLTFKMVIKMCLNLTLYFNFQSSDFFFSLQNICIGDQFFVIEICWLLHFCFLLMLPNFWWPIESNIRKILISEQKSNNLLSKLHHRGHANIHTYILAAMEIHTRIFSRNFLWTTSTTSNIL